MPRRDEKYKKYERKTERRRRNKISLVTWLGEE